MPLCLSSLALLSLSVALPPQQGFDGNPLERPRRVEIPFNRLYDSTEIYAHFDAIATAWPRFLEHQVIGQSVEGRELRVYVINNPETGEPAEKPAMWVDGNVHGNEIQGAEVALYLAWYLGENYGTNDRITELVDRTTFYILPMVNPDGRDHWIHEAHSASSSRTGYQPTDIDRDGLFDEDPPDDLDGDGHITSMRKHVPGRGTYRLNQDDPRIMEYVPPNDRGIRGDWIFLGREGIDNDSDGRINEDSAGGYDMNRAWPGLWRPDHVQRGAGPYPLYWPETRCIARFLCEHPNIAGVQSFHNAGGMILRGPGAEAHGEYPRADIRVFDELGADGEKMLPFYRYMVLWKDLYTVFGGFVTWTYEDLGVISFTNELWTSKRMYPDDGVDRSSESRHWFDDNLLSGAGFIDWHPHQHPFYGEIEIGGFRKDVGRVPPSFLIEEMVHRNALFCIKHAAAMPEIVVGSTEVTALPDGISAIDVIFENRRAIPTRTAHAAAQEIGEPDVFTILGEGVEALAGGFRTDRWRAEAIELAERNPHRLVREKGIGSRAEVRVRWFVRGSGTVTLSWSGQKGRDVAVQVDVP
jgi:hypothetical protein